MKSISLKIENLDSFEINFNRCTLLLVDYIN